MTKKVKVDGLSFYASVHRPNAKSGVYVIDLAVDSETETKLIAEGLKPARRATGDLVEHKGAEGMKVFRFKSKAISAKGQTLSPPSVVDSQGNACTDLIGNGSKVRVYATIRPYNVVGGGSGVAAYLNIVQIIDLVSFSTVDKVDGGFVSASTGSSDSTSNDVNDSAFDLI